MKHFIDKNTNEIFAYEADGSQDDYIKQGLVAITDSDLATLRGQKELDRLDTQYYSEKRAEAYPSIVDQLDDIYHNGLAGWKANIKTIKNEYPKG